MSSNIEQKIASKIMWAWEDGCPVATHRPEVAAEMAAIARRRWNSFPRRNKNVTDNVDHRINDLARGLAEKFTQGGWPMVGPTIADYQWLCKQIAPVLLNDE